MCSKVDQVEVSEVRNKELETKIAGLHKDLKRHQDEETQRIEV